MRALPLCFSLCPELQKWTLITEGEMALPLDHSPKYLNYWSKAPHDRVFGAIPNAF